ncbi:MAG: hypothetical protein ACXW2Y_10860 [Acidimicrobiia bacterium]
MPVDTPPPEVAPRASAFDVLPGAARAAGADEPGDPTADPGVGTDGSAPPDGEGQSRGEGTIETLTPIVLGLAVVACCAYVLWQLRPDLLLRDTTANGGDMAAHVWFPAYLRDHLLPNWRVAGWSPDWYAGFPAGQFYFPIPAVLTVLLDLVMPYNVAFKIVTVIGPVTLPAAAYACARGLGLRRIAATMCAPAMVAFLFFKGAPGTSQAATSIAFNQGIMGGTLRSNLAGEFSYTLALALALCFFGALAVALRDSRRPWLPAVLLAAVVLSHLVVGIFAGVGAVVIWLFYRPARTALIAFAIGAVGALLTMFWSLPLLASFGYTSNMRYEKITEYVTYLFPTYFWWAFAFAAVALIGAGFRRDRGPFVVFTMTLVFALVFRLWPEAHAWNLRFLPFWYVGLFLLAGIGAAEIPSFARWTVEWVMTEPDLERVRPASSRGAVLGAGAAALVVVLLTGVTLVRVDATRGFLRFWADWNYSGYEDTSGLATADHRPKPWPEFQALIEEMRALPPGRALWEGGGSIDAYGSSLALMMLPYFTEGHTTSMEGLYYESSGTTPYHFMAASTVEGAGNASNPVRGLKYRDITDFDLGVEYLRMLGVNYYLAYSTDARAKADTNAGLEKVATVADRDGKAPMGWAVYKVRNAPLVQPLANQPVVATGRQGGTQSECFGTPEPPASAGADEAPTDPSLTPWECLSAAWWDTPDALDRLLASDGPASWVRAPADRAADAKRTPLPAIEVSNTRSTDDSVSFDVSRTGVPVLVKVSDYPNWAVRGAEGPYRVTPNFMVVVPTAKHVELHYTRTPAEWIGIAATLLGVVGLVGLVLLGRPARRRRVHPSNQPAPEGDEAAGPGEAGRSAAPPALR